MNMKRMIAITLAALMLLVCLSACEKKDAVPEEPAAPTDPAAEDSPVDHAETGETMIYAHIGDNTLVIRPEDNSSAEAFIALLEEGDITISMHDYGSFEKVGALGASLPRNDENITTEPGDLILYQGNQITIYYDTNTWSFTRLGRVQDLTQTELKGILGESDVDVTFSLK